MNYSIEELEALLQEVKLLKASAQTNTEFSDYDEAIADLSRAIALLDPPFGYLITLPAEASEVYSDLRYRCAVELADCHGMIGGNHRRKGDLDQAEGMYMRGSSFERDYGIPETYNRTNVIVLQLIRDPSRHDALRPLIQSAREAVSEQVNGKNKNKWWAWADFGLLNLLSIEATASEARKSDYRAIASEAYRTFKNNGARRQNFESTIGVLTDLQSSLAKVDQEVATAMQDTLGFLNKNMPDQ
jgi:tetratricopeptide (TPR) repeat protein